MSKIRLRPTGNLSALVVLGFVFWYAGTSQGNNAAFLLGFLVFAITALSLLHGWLNLRSVRLRTDAIRSVFAGEDLLVPVEISNAGRKTSYGLRIRFESHESREQIITLQPGKAWRGQLILNATKRGRFIPPPVYLCTRFPLGFFEMRKRIVIEQEVLIYPHPAGSSMLPTEGSGQAGEQALRINDSGEDFAGVRPYRPGESQRRIDWKAVARGAPLVIKEFSGIQQQTLWLDIGKAGNGTTEERLSQLTLWALQAENEALRYGLRLGNKHVPVGNGELHLQTILQRLALYDSHEKGEREHAFIR